MTGRVLDLVRSRDILQGHGTAAVKASTDSKRASNEHMQEITDQRGLIIDTGTGGTFTKSADTVDKSCRPKVKEKKQ